MIKACIFDCDGTLLDTLLSIAVSANRALKDYGLEEIPVEDYKRMVGDGAGELVKRCLKKAGGGDFEKVYKRYREYFTENCMYEVKPYEGICEMLEKLKGQGMMSAVLSNKPHLETVDVIEKSFPKGTFEMILGADPKLPRKPAPDGALKIAKCFGMKPEECLYIGDTNTDMQTGNSAGMQTVGVLWGFRERKELEENQARFIVSKPEEILQIPSQVRSKPSISR